MKKTKFGLRRKETENLIKVREEKIKSSRGINTYYILNEEVGEEWLIDTLEDAIRAKNAKKEWYEGTYKEPSHEYEDLEVIEITRIEILEIRSEEDLNFKEEGQEEPKDKKEKTDFIIRIANEEKKEEDKNKDFGNVITKKKQETIKMIVSCKRTMYEQHGKIIMSNQPKTVLFEEGQEYLSYIKDDEVYVLSERNTPEFFCRMNDKGMEDSTLFDMYFGIKEIKQ